MRRAVGTLADILLLSAVVLGIIALWGLLPTESREEVPATLRVVQGKASVLTPGGRNEQTVGSLASLSPGARLRVPAGGDAFLLYADGSVSRVTGPVDMVIEESTRTLRKPAVLTRMLAMVRGSAPPPPDEVSVVVKARVLRGEVINKVAPPSSRNSLFELKAPATIVIGGSTSFIMAVRDNGETSVEVGQGTVRIAMVSASGPALTPVIIPQLASRQGVLIPALASGAATTPEVRDVLSSLETTLPRLDGASGPISVGGISFREVRSGDIPYLVGERSDTAQLRAFASRPSQPQTAAAVQAKTTVPGSKTFVLTDRDLGSNLPPPFPPGTKIHVLAGNAVKVETGDMTVVATVSAVDGRLDIRGLPLDVNPAQVSQALVERLGIGGQTPPPFLSVSSESGRLSFMYATDVITQQAGVSGVQSAEAPPSLPRTAEYFKTIPTPREVSTDWKVVGSNVFLAALIAYLISVFSGFANAFVSKRETHLAGHVNRVTRVAVQVAGWRGLKGRAISWISNARFTRAVLMMFLFGLLYSFLSSGTGLFGPGGLTIFLTLSLTTGFFALYEPWVRSFVARRMKLTAKVALYPGQAAVAFVSVAISRLLSFTPGLMLGKLSELVMPEQGPTPKQKMTLGVVSLVSVAGLGTTAWGAAFALPIISQQQWAQGFFRTAQGLTSWIQDWCLAAFAMAVQRVFTELLPLPKSTGQEILRRNLIVWGIPFALAVFLFIHTQMNRQKNLLELTPQVYVTFAAVVLLGVAAQIYTIRESRRKSTAAETPRGIV